LPVLAQVGATVDTRANSANCRRILIVEDQLDSRQTFEKLLSLYGYQVEAASDGLTGLQKALWWKPDVVILDIGLPFMSGYEVAHALREHLGTRTTLVALTAYGQPEDRQRAFAAGFDDHFTKPADLNRLMSVLNQAPERQ
jgi:CheY-like chemotaxis protein